MYMLYVNISFGPRAVMLCFNKYIYSLKPKLGRNFHLACCLKNEVTSSEVAYPSGDDATRRLMMPDQLLTFTHILRAKK